MFAFGSSGRYGLCRPAKKQTSELASEDGESDASWIELLVSFCFLPVLGWPVDE